MTSIDATATAHLMDGGEWNEAYESLRTAALAAGYDIEHPSGRLLARRLSGAHLGRAIATEHTKPNVIYSIEHVGDRVLVGIDRGGLISVGHGEVVDVSGPSIEAREWIRRREVGLAALEARRSKP